MEWFRLFFDHFAIIQHQFFCGIRDSRNAQYDVIKVVKGGLGGGHKETFIIPENVWLGFGVKQIRDSLSCTLLLGWILIVNKSIWTVKLVITIEIYEDH